MANPKCRHCGKPLNQNTRTHWLNATPGTGYQPPEGDEEVLQRREVGTRYENWRIATGRYGYNGDGLFCTLRCGYEYAVATVSRRA